MSPIIYTPHDCDRPYLATVGQDALWQCETCGRVWGSDSAGWSLAADPRRTEILREACSPTTQPETPTIPTMTPDMVQFAVDTYTDHTSTVTRGESTYCAACNELLTGIIEFRLHALSMAYDALQNALKVAGADG